MQVRPRVLFGWPAGIKQNPPGTRAIRARVEKGRIRGGCGPRHGSNRDWRDSRSPARRRERRGVEANPSCASGLVGQRWPGWRKGRPKPRGESERWSTGRRKSGRCRSAPFDAKTRTTEPHRPNGDHRAAAVPCHADRLRVYDCRCGIHRRLESRYKLRDSIDPGNWLWSARCRVFIIMPILLFMFYIYLHLYLYRLCQILGTLPSVFHDGTPLDQAVSPWLPTAFVRFFQKHGVRPPSLVGLSQKWVTIMVVWWVAPAALALFWVRYLVRHDWDGTALHALLVAVAVWSAVVLHRLAAAALHGGRRPFRGLGGALYSVGLLAAIGAVVVAISIGAIEGVRGTTSLDTPRSVRCRKVRAAKLIADGLWVDLRRGKYDPIRQLRMGTPDADHVSCLPAGPTLAFAAGLAGVGSPRAPGSSRQRCGRCTGLDGVLCAQRGGRSTQRPLRAVDDGQGADLCLRDGHILLARGGEEAGGGCSVSDARGGQLPATSHGM